MNILFIAAGPIEWASSRIRAYWVAEQIEDARVVQYNDIPGKNLHGYDVYIWQKLADAELIGRLGGRHYWDVCDPAWWWQPEGARRIADTVTAVVASSPGLAEDFNEWYGRDKATCIPDRLKLGHFHRRRQHTAVSPVRFIWFGLHLNRIALYGALPSLDRLAANGHKIELTIMDDRPDWALPTAGSRYPIYYTKWQLDKEVEILASHDIALLPPYPGPWGRVKSNNKILTAWACGLPTVGNDWQNASDYKRLELRVASHEERQELAEQNSQILERRFRVQQSAADWLSLLDTSRADDGRNGLSDNGHDTSPAKYQEGGFVR